jgi:phospholipid-transporting ATPase
MKEYYQWASCSGCVLRNTDWAIALVVNTGHDTKIMMSGTCGSSWKQHVLWLKCNGFMSLSLLMLAGLATKTKFSGLEYEATIQIQRIIIFLLLVCFGAATGQAVLNEQVNIGSLSYLHDWNPNPILWWFIEYFYSLLLHASFIPVSLYVSMSLVRYYQSVFMDWDLDMYYEPVDTPAKVRTMTLNEELGQISHIFTDKTGCCCYISITMCHFKEPLLCLSVLYCRDFNAQ